MAARYLGTTAASWLTIRLDKRCQVKEVLERIPKWLRWLMAVPLSALTIFIVYWAVVLGGIVMNFLGPTGAAWGNNFFAYLLAPGVSGFSSTYVVHSVVPNHKRIAAVTIAGLWVGISGFLVVFALLSKQWAIALAAVSAVVGVVVALYSDELISN